MNRYKATINTIVEGEDEENAIEELCRDICKNATGEIQLELLTPLEKEEENHYTVNLTVKITDKVSVHAKTLEGAKNAAKRAFFSDLSEYQIVNAAVEQMDVEIEKNISKEVKK